MLRSILLALGLVCPDGTVIPLPDCPSVSTVTVASTSSTTSTTAGGGVGGSGNYRTIYGAGYLGTYGPDTIPAWPTKLLVMKGEANQAGPLVAAAKQRAAAAGNREAKFVFYLSLTDMDNRCQCYDQQFYDSFAGAHPEWILRNSGGGTVATSNDDHTHRVLGVDIGNPSYIDAWIAWVMRSIDKYGWDGVMADNVIRCIDPPFSWDGWSATPVNPRTHSQYTCDQYRTDMIAALGRIRAAFDARGKFLLGNHSGAWHGTTFADPKIRQEVVLMHGVELEDCVFDYNTNPHSEQELLEQLAYMDYANRLGVMVDCSGLNRGDVGRPPKRDSLVAFSLLTKEKFSTISEFNTLGAWWPGRGSAGNLLPMIELGAPRGHYECVNAAGVVTQPPCTAGIPRRQFEKGVAVFNTTAIPRTIPLGQSTNSCGSSVTIPARTGRVCQ